MRIEFNNSYMVSLISWIANWYDHGLNKLTRGTDLSESQVILLLCSTFSIDWIYSRNSFNGFLLGIHIFITIINNDIWKQECKNYGNFYIYNKYKD